MTFYKATRPDGTDFHSGTIDYAAALVSGTMVTHPLKTTRRKGNAHYLSVATVATDCTGMSWPCRLFEVEPIGETWAPAPSSLPSKVACKSLRVVRELDAVDALGPQGSQLRDLIGQARKLAEPQSRALAAAWYAAWDAAWAAAWYAARDAAWAAAWAAAWYAAGAAAWDAAWDAAGAAARDAAWALSVRDLIGTRLGWDQAAYDILTAPWRQVVGPIHPDDPELAQ